VTKCNGCYILYPLFAFPSNKVAAPPQHFVAGFVSAAWRCVWSSLLRSTRTVIDVRNH